MNRKELDLALKAIADGYEYEIIKKQYDHFDEYYVSVMNPDFKEDDGSHYYLLFEVKL